MRALAFDTATDVLSVALQSDDGIRCFELDSKQRQSERLMELAHAACASARMDPSKLELIACMGGPGSFTGLRIGMAAAKGIACALGIPLIAVPTLDCLAEPHKTWPGKIMPVIDAKKAHFFTALYKNGTRYSEYLDASLDDIAPLFAGPESVLITGPDAESAYEKLLPVLGSTPLILDAAYRRAHGRELLEIALHRFENEGRGDPDSLGPVYLRKSEAELTREMSRIP